MQIRPPLWIIKRHPQVAIAARWWAGALARPDMLVSVVPDEPCDHGWMPAARQLSNCAETENRKVRAFRDAVLGELARRIRMDGYPVKVSVDYVPDALLWAAGERAGVDLPMGMLPPKTRMQIGFDTVEVSVGRAQPYVVIWSQNS